MSISSIKSAGVAASAVATGLLLWGLRTAGIDLSLGESGDAGAVDVLLAMALAGLTAAAVHAALFQRSKARVWPLAGSAALAISILEPGRLAEGESTAALLALPMSLGFVLAAGFGGLVERIAGDVGRTGRDQHTAAPRPEESNSYADSPFST